MSISIAKKNGYTLKKVMLAKQYLDEIGNKKRNFDFSRLVEMYNDIYETHESAGGCKCNAPKYYNGISNYLHFGKLTLINNGLATEADFEIKKKTTEVKEIENAENRIVIPKEEDVKEIPEEIEKIVEEVEKIDVNPKIEEDVEANDGTSREKEVEDEKIKFEVHEDVKEEDEKQKEINERMKKARAARKANKDKAD